MSKIDQQENSGHKCKKDQQENSGHDTNVKKDQQENSGQKCQKSTNVKTVVKNVKNTPTGKQWSKM